MKSFKNLKDLSAYLNKSINESLTTTVADTVRKKMQAQIDQTVYDAYDPSFYIRRYDSGGLRDAENIVAELITDGELRVINVARLNSGSPLPNGVELAEVIEYGLAAVTGTKNDYPPYGQPRPFIKNTRADLESSKEHVKALKEGLKNHGIDCI
jgi:hypothetical protein